MILYKAYADHEFVGSIPERRLIRSRSNSEYYYFIENGMIFAREFFQRLYPRARIQINFDVIPWGDDLDEDEGKEKITEPSDHAFFG